MYVYTYLCMYVCACIYMRTCVRGESLRFSDHVIRKIDYRWQFKLNEIGLNVAGTERVPQGPLSAAGLVLAGMLVTSAWFQMVTTLMGITFMVVGLMVAVIALMRKMVVVIALLVMSEVAVTRETKSLMTLQSLFLPFVLIKCVLLFVKLNVIINITRVHVAIVIIISTIT